jgi:hypothetical protein
MKTLAGVVGLLSTTVLFTVALLWVNPFERVSSILDAIFGAAPKWTQLSNADTDPLIGDVSHGDYPLSALATVGDGWQRKPDAARVVLIGNSQMFAMSLAPGETPQTGPERTYPDLMASQLALNGVLCYRLAAPGMSYSEALWYLDYLLAKPELRPSVLVLQVNYQAFWSSGIRESMFELLEDPRFRARIEERSQSNDAFAEDFQVALKKFDERARASKAPKETVKRGFGTALEDATRARLENSFLYKQRPIGKASFAAMLYRARLYFLRIKPSNARSIAGPRLTRSQAALDAIAAISQSAGVRLVLFTAPLNPRVSLYASPNDKEGFDGFVQRLAMKYGLHLFDLENTVPANLWGRQFNGPDPLHMGRRAHQLVADVMVRAVCAALRRES